MLMFITFPVIVTDKLLFVNQDFNDPFEHAVKKGVTFAGVDLCFCWSRPITIIVMGRSSTFGFNRILPVLPLEYFEGDEVEVQAFLEFGDVRILDERDGVLPRFRDVGCWKDFTRKTTGMPDVWVVSWDSRSSCDTDAFHGDVCLVMFHDWLSGVVFILINVYMCSDNVQFIIY